MWKKITFLLAISTAAQSDQHQQLLNSSGDIVGQIDRAIQLVGAATEYSHHGVGISDGNLSETAHISTDMLNAYNDALYDYANTYLPYGDITSVLEQKAEEHLSVMNDSIDVFTDVVVSMSTAIQVNEKVAEATTPDDKAEVQEFVQANQEMLVITEQQTEEFNQATDDIETNANAAAVYLAVAASDAATYLQDSIEDNNTHADDVTLFYDANAQWVQMGYNTTRQLTVVMLAGNNDFGLDLYASEADILAIGAESEFYQTSPVAQGYDCFFNMECE
jgi:hypothetical protein